jgi:hypothetical protein
MRLKILQILLFTGAFENGNHHEVVQTSEIKPELSASPAKASPPDESDAAVPVIEAIHTPVDIKSCQVKLTQLDSLFVKNCCQGSVNLSSLPPNFPEHGYQLQCNICKLILKDREEMKLHNFKAHPDFKQCPSCLKIFSSKVDIRKHLAEMKCFQKQAPECLNFYCPKCAYSVDNYRSLSKHYCVSHKGQELSDWVSPCWKCNHVYFEKKQLFDHFKYSHPSVHCRYCIDKFANNVQFLSHFPSNHPDFKFTDCFKMISEENLLCIVCEAKFKDELAVSKHFLNYHFHLLCVLENPGKLEDLIREAEEQSSLGKTPNGMWS